MSQPNSRTKTAQRFTPGFIGKCAHDIWNAHIDDKSGKRGACLWLGQIEVRGGSRKEAIRLRSLILKALEGQ